MQFLEPFNLFFYTWRYLTALEDEETLKALKTFYRLFKEIAMALFPLPLFVFIGIFLREGIYEWRYFDYRDFYKQNAGIFQKIIGYLSLGCNLISCINLVLVMAHMRKTANYVQIENKP